MNCGIIGLGRMGRRTVEACIKMGVSPSFMCDIREENLLAVRAELHSDARIFTNVEDFFQNPMQLLIISTTTDTHFTYLERGISLGIPYILCEKPVVRSQDEYQKLVKLLQTSDTIIAVNHQMRFLPQYTKILEIQDEYKLGTLSSIIFNAGNFGLANNGTHYVCAACFLADSRPKFVTAKLDDEILPNPRGVQFSDRSGFMHIQMVNGTDVIINAKASQGHGCIANYVFRNGQIFVDELEGTMYLNCRTENSIAEPTTRYGMPNITKTIQIKPIDVIDGTGMVLDALTKKDNFPTLEEAFIAVKTIMAAYKSNGTKIDIDNFRCDDEFQWA